MHIYPNNYKYSTLRAYLNGSYEEDDQQQKIYTGCGFLQKAFTPAAQELIMETEVDNSLESCLDYNATPPRSVTQIDYICDNTLDKIFVLSESFVSDFYHYYAEFKDHQVTDYAIANYAIMSNPKSIAGGWLRTPGNSSTYACVYSFDPSVTRFDVDKKRNILPALRVSELPE